MNPATTSIVTLAHFEQQLVASRLLDAARLDELRATRVEDAKSAARWLVSKGLLSKWQAGQLLGGFHRLMVGNYRLVQEVGRGRWGRVYVAEHRRLRKRFALKVLASQLSQQSERVEQFFAAARLSADFDHPNLAQALDAGWDGERCYSVMEYVAGSDLRQHVQKHGPVAVGFVIEWSHQVASACRYLHGRGIVHGNVCPSKLLIGEGDTIKVLGAADATSPSGVAQATDGELTSSRYASPEQVAGGTPDFSWDVYSLGQTMRFLLSGRPPERDESGAFATAMDASFRDLPSAPWGLRELIAQMTAADSHSRIRDMAEVVIRLESWLAEASAEVHSPSEVAQSPRTVRPVTVQRPDADGNQIAPGAIQIPPSRPDHHLRTLTRDRRSWRAIRTRISALVAVGLLILAGMIWICVRDA